VRANGDMRSVGDMCFSFSPHDEREEEGKQHSWGPAYAPSFDLLMNVAQGRKGLSALYPSLTVAAPKTKSHSVRKRRFKEAKRKEGMLRCTQFS